MDEREPHAVSSDPAPARMGGACARTAVVLLLAALFAVVMGLVGYALEPRFLPRAASNLASDMPPETTGWRVYHDPLDLFTMRLPPGWTADASLGGYSEGGPGYSDSGQDEGVTFRNPALGVASPQISVYAQPIHNGGRQMECASGPRGTSTFNGFLADESHQAVIVFDTESSHFQIGETIPGVFGPDTLGGGPNPPTPPPAPPAATVTAERGLLAAALTTFQPTDTHPLTCG